jgi:secreted Zn-dependent insulinase-like peptidase
MKNEILSKKSKSDVKDYEFLQLDSGLQVILVSSEKLKKTIKYDHGISNIKGAAAITVQVGSFADPVECEGLAHFLEHMVFMGR